MKQNRHVKRMLVIMLSLMMAISLMGVFTVLSYADGETFVPSDHWGNLEMLPNEEYWIDKNSSYPIDDNEVSVQITSIEIDDEEIAEVNYSDNNGYNIRSKKKGTTTATIKYKVKGENEKPHTINISVVDHRYDFYLELDSMYNKILPGETVVLSTCLKKGEYNEEKNCNDWQEIEADDYDCSLEELDNYIFDDNDGEDRETNIMGDKTGSNPWQITAEKIPNGDDGVRRGYARYSATATYDGKTIKSDDVEFWIEPEFYQIHNAGDYADKETTNTRELLEGNTLNANINGDKNIDFEIWKKAYNNGPQITLVEKNEVKDLYIEDCDDWDFFDGDGDDDNPTRKLTVANKEDRDLPWEGNIFVKVDVDDGYWDSNPVPVKINGYRLKYEDLNTGDNDGEHDMVKVFLSSDAVGATPEVNVKAFVPNDKLQENEYEMEYELGYYDHDGFHAEGTTTGTTSQQGCFGLDQNELQTLYNKYNDENGYCELVVQARAKAKNDNDNGIYAKGEFYIQIEDSTEQSLNNISDEEILLPGERFGINMSDWGYFYNEEYPEGEESSYVISEAPTIVSDSDKWYNLKPYEKNDGWYFEVNSNESSIGKSATVSFKYKLIKTDEDGNPETSNIERVFTINVNVVGTKYNLSLDIASGYDDILPGETVELSTSLEKGVYIPDEDYNDWQEMDADDYSLEELDNYCFGDNEERTPIMGNPTGNNPWNIKANEISDGDGVKNGEAGYHAIATVDGEEIYSNDVWIHVNSKFYEIHNNGELAEKKPIVNELLVGEELEATYASGDANFEIWKREYKEVDDLITDDVTVDYFGFDDWDGDIFHCDKKEGTEVLTATNDLDWELPWDGTIRMKAKIDGEDYYTSVPVKVYEYEMSFEGLNNLDYADGIPNTIVYLSSDAVGANPEVSVKAELLSADGIDDYSMTYNMSYFYHDTWETVEINGGSKELNKDTRFTLSKEELYNLHDKNERLGDFDDETVIFVEAIAHNGNVEYARESFLVGIWGETYTQNEYWSINEIVPGEVIDIPKTSGAYFENESVYSADEGHFKDYTISGEPTVSCDGSWCTIESNGDNWKICAASDAANHVGGKITFSFNYTIEGYPNVLRKFTKEISVANEKLKLDPIKEGEQMLFGESRTITPSVTYTYFENGQCNVKSHANISGITYNLEWLSSDLDDENSYTSFEKTDSNKWKITAKNISDFDGYKPDCGSDYYKLTASADGLTAEEEISMSVFDEYYAIEHSSKKTLELNVNASESDRKIQLSDFALYRHYLDENNTSKLEKITDNNVKFAWYRQKLFEKAGNVLTLKDKNALSADGIQSDAYPIKTDIEFTTEQGRYFGFIDVNIISKEETSGGGGGGGATEPTEPETKPEIDVDPTSGGVIADIGGETKVEGDKASAVITADTAKEIVEAAAKSGTTEIKLDASVKESVDKTELEIPMTIAEVADTNGASVEIATNVGSVVLDKQTVKGLAKTDADSITVSVEKTDASGEDKAVFDITLTAVKDGKATTISKLQGTAQVVAPLPSGLKAEEACGLYLNGKLAEKVTTKVDGKNVVLTVKHFSTYGIMSNDEADKLFKTSAEATTMGKLTLKTYKGGKIKASWKNGTGNTGDITKYQVYYKQSGKKAKYTTTTSKSKTIKKLKKGKTYTVKTRAYIKINGKTYKSKWTTAKKIKCK